MQTSNCAPDVVCVSIWHAATALSNGTALWPVQPSSFPLLAQADNTASAAKIITLIACSTLKPGVSRQLEPHAQYVVSFAMFDCADTTASFDPDIARYDVSEDGVNWRPYDPARDISGPLHTRIIFADPQEN